MERVVLRDGERVGLLAGLEIMAKELEFFTRLVVGDVGTADFTAEILVVVKLLGLWSWAYGV